MTKIQSLFNEVKTTFFPRWDSANKWRVQRKAKLSTGYARGAICNNKTKTIEISRTLVLNNDNEYRCLFAHEICHAVTDAYHGQKWQTRYLKVANQAKLLRMQTLAKMISEDIKNIQDAEVVNLSVIQQNMEDAINFHPNASFEAVIEFVANNWGYTADGLLKKYKSIKKLFDKVKRDAV